MKQNYTAIWYSAGLCQLANVSFTASSRAGVTKSARKIARQIGMRPENCHVYQNGALVVKGV